MTHVCELRDESMEKSTFNVTLKPCQSFPLIHGHTKEDGDVFVLVSFCCSKSPLKTNMAIVGNSPFVIGNTSTHSWLLFHLSSFREVKFSPAVQFWWPWPFDVWGFPFRSSPFAPDFRTCRSQKTDEFIVVCKRKPTDLNQKWGVRFGELISQI